METTVAMPSAKIQSVADTVQIPTFVYATVFASFCIIVGLIWDISWHTSIGRDGLAYLHRTLRCIVGAISLRCLFRVSDIKNFFFWICMPAKE